MHSKLPPEKKATFLECTRCTKFGCWSSMSGCFSSLVWALPRESLTKISLQVTVEVATWFCIATLTRWILTCLCWTSSGHRKLAATYLLSLCIYLRSCCLTWKSLHIALYSMFWVWQLYLWICFTGKQWMPLIQKLFRAILAECALWKKAALLEILPVTCFMWSCITSEFTCDTMIPKHDFLNHVLLHYLKLTCEGFEDPIGVTMWRCSMTLELTCHGFEHSSELILWSCITCELTCGSFECFSEVAL